MFRDLSQLARKQPPGEPRRFGSADNPAFLREVLKSSWIPKSRKDNVPKKEGSKAKSPLDVLIIEEKAVEQVVEIVPMSLAEPEPPRVPLVPMSRQAWNKTLKSARKVAASTPGAGNPMGSSKRPMMRSSATTPAKRRKHEKAKRVPKVEQPPFVLNDAAYREAAQKALNGFSQRQRKVFHAIDVMVMMRDPRARREEYNSILIAYAFGCLEDAVAEARSAGTVIDRRFLHAKSSRAFGQLIKMAWKCQESATDYNESEIRGWWVRHFDDKEMEIFFLVDSKDRPHMIHTAMGKDRFKQWTRGWSCCELNPPEKPKKRSRP